MKQDKHPDKCSLADGRHVWTSLKCFWTKGHICFACGKVAENVDPEELKIDDVVIPTWNIDESLK